MTHAQTRFTRGDVLRRGGAITAGIAIGTPLLTGFRYAESDDEIKIGIIDDHTGDFALPNIPKSHGAQLAVDEINAKGGVNGSKLKLIVYDGQSDVNRYQDLAQRLTLGDKVNVIMAGYTSSEREAARAVAVKNKTIFWHNNQGEGGISSRYSFFTGPVPEQQVLPGIKFMIKKFGPRFYILSPDYGFGHVNSQWTHVAAGIYGGKVLNEEFIPLGNSEFSATIQRIQKAKPDFLAVYMVGAAQSQFFPQAAAAGLTALPKFSTVNLQQGYEHKRFKPPVLYNMWVPTEYQEELPTPANKRFVKAWHAKWPREPYINEPGRDAYVAVNLMAEAWKKAGTADTDKTIAALQSGVSFRAPDGPVQLDPAVHHCAMTMYMAFIDRKHNLHFTNLGMTQPWWLRRNMRVDLRKSDPEAQYTPTDDPKLKKYL